MSGWLARWRPRSMTAQLVCLLFGGLVLSHALTLVVVRDEELIHPISRQQALEKIGAAYRLATLFGADARAPQALAALQTDFHAQARTPLAARPMSPDEWRVQGELRRDLRLDADAVRVRVSANAQDDKVTDLVVSLKLADGRWINSVQQPKLIRKWWRPLRVSVPASVIPVLLIIFFFLRRILRPIETLAQAAHSISRGEEIAPLPLVGPREAREVTASFNLMQERLRRHMAERSYLLAAISHDLRTPITSLRLRAELIDEPALRAIMQGTLAEMAQMVDETLCFASDDARSETTQERDLVALLQAMVDDQVVQGRDVLLRTDMNILPYRCRPLALKRALNNLVDNAVRYGQCARISMVRATHGIAIRIDDAGPGIPETRRDEVFKPFFRMEPSRHRDGHGDGGVGLGLSIARTNIEAHGGELSLANLPQGGLRATVLLPG